MGTTQRQNSHRCVGRHPATFLLSLSFPVPSFHPSLPHIHDLVINLVEISCSLITPPPHSSLLFHCILLFLPPFGVEGEEVCWLGLLTGGTGHLPPEASPDSEALASTLEPRWS